MILFTRIFILAFWTMLFLPSCSIDLHSVKGNGNITTKEINIDDYEQIQLQGVGDIIYEQESAEPPYLQITTDDNILPLLDIKVEKGILIVRSIDGQNINPSRLRIHTNSTNIKGVEISGSGEVHLSGEVNAGNVKLSIPGSGTIASDSLYCDQVELTISGSGKAHLGGVCNDAQFAISGSGNITAADYQIQNLGCSVSGSGNIKAHVNKSLKASISGSGNIKYTGNPQTVNENISGSGSITREE